MAVPLPGDETTRQILFEEFGSLNVRDARFSIKDDEWAWYENVMPIGKGNLRTIYAEGGEIYTAPVGRLIIYKYAYNLGSTDYFAVFLDNGTAVQVRISDGATTTISSTANTFWQTPHDLPCCSQWESKYLLIVGSVTSNGYWIWDGSVLFGAGTLGPDVNVTYGGSGYTSAPTVTAVGGTGSGATFVATVQDGSVTKVAVTNPGSGYSSGDIVQLAFTGGGSDTSATATLVVSTTVGGVGAVNITNGGTKYDTTTTISFSGGGGTDAAAVVTGLQDGVITEITIINTGKNYTSAPTVAAAGPSGSAGFAALAEMRYGQVTGITVVSGGSGYSTAGTPEVVISAPDLPALPLVQATAQVSTVTAGAIAAFTILNPGLGYSKGTVTLIGGNKAAAGSVSVMPFGVSGTTIETYQGHVWIFNGTTGVATAPASVTEFAVSKGGVAFQATESFLRKQVTRLIANNGFLYLIGDSSINVVSNVQTNVAAGSTVATTTFSNSNIDPQVGTIWRESVVAFQRALIFANPTGIYALYGGAAQKISDQIDNLFSAASFNTGQTGVTPTSSVATIFGIKVFAFLFSTTDPYSGTYRRLMACWTGNKWFITTSINPMTAITIQESGSNVMTYGDDGQNIYPMFSTPSATLSKVWRSKLRYETSYIIQKQLLRVYLVQQINNYAGYLPVALQFDYDGGNNIGMILNNPFESVIQFNNNSILPIDFTTPNPPTYTVSFAIQNFTPEASDLQAYGQAIGLTGQTYAADVTILSMSLLYRDYAPRA